MIRINRDTKQTIDGEIVTNSEFNYELKFFGIKLYKMKSHVTNEVDSSTHKIKKAGFNNGK